MRSPLLAWLFLIVLAPACFAASAAPAPASGKPAAAAAGSAKAAAAAPVSSKEPIKIKSDVLHADNEKKTAVFQGNVVARQGDLTLYADRLQITYSGDAKELSQVEAFGNVRLLQGNRQASSSHAIYHTKEGRILLDGQPRVVQDEDVITGKLITYYVNEKRSEVSGGPSERVEAVIHPGGKDAGSKP